ncbi:MAG: AMP-binding protein, partial [Bacteroidales bacterium]
MDIIIKPRTLAQCFNESIVKYANNKSFEIINGESLTYKDFGIRVKSLIDKLNKNGVPREEKIAILGGSMPNWPVSYMAVTTSARIAVPLLPDFSAFEIANIVEHSGSKAIIVSKRLIYKLSDAIRDKFDLIICMDTLEELKVASDNNILGTDNAPTPVSPQPPLFDDIASIIYTSGTSGASKGVMLTHANLTSNIEMTKRLFVITEKDVFLSFLPLSHAYECTLGMLYPITEGASVSYLDGAPTPSLLMPALKKVRPTCICSV